MKKNEYFFNDMKKYLDVSDLYWTQIQPKIQGKFQDFFLTGGNDSSNKKYSYLCFWLCCHSYLVSQPVLSSKHTTGAHRHGLEVLSSSGISTARAVRSQVESLHLEQV